MGRPAVFLDKDGTLVENVPYNVDPARVRLAAGAGAALRRLRAAGYRLVVVTNQSGVARGYHSEDDVQRVADHLGMVLAALGAPLAGFYYCPHLACAGRKPAPGMVRRAGAELDVDLARSWLVGDILDDVEAGARAGCRTVLVQNGGETEWRRGPFRHPTAVVPDLSAAAEFILSSP